MRGGRGGGLPSYKSSGGVILGTWLAGQQPLEETGNARVPGQLCMGWWAQGLGAQGLAVLWDGEGVCGLVLTWR